MVPFTVAVPLNLFVSLMTVLGACIFELIFLLRFCHFFYWAEYSVHETRGHVLFFIHSIILSLKYLTYAPSVSGTMYAIRHSITICWNSPFKLKKKLCINWEASSKNSHSWIYPKQTISSESHWQWNMKDKPIKYSGSQILWVLIQTTATEWKS